MNPGLSWVSTPVLGRSIYIFSLTQLWQAGWQTPSQGHWQRADRSFTCTSLDLNPGPFLIEVPGFQNGLYQWDFDSEVFIERNWNYSTVCDSENLKKNQNWRFLDFEILKKNRNQNLFYKIKDPHNIVNTWVESTMSNTCAILDAPHY